MKSEFCPGVVFVFWHSWKSAEVFETCCVLLAGGVWVVLCYGMVGEEVMVQALFDVVVKVVVRCEVGCES